MKCSRCRRRPPAGPRSKYCTSCFQVLAADAGRKSGGNSQGNPGNAGNPYARGSAGYVDNPCARGHAGNAGNPCARGNASNVGNARKGAVKKHAGKRSGIRRSAKQALVVKKVWLDLILSGRKTWEIRGMATSKRCWIHFAESQAGGLLMGRARLVDCIPLSATTEAGFKKDFTRHRVPSLKVVPYKRPYAWVFERSGALF